MSAPHWPQIAQAASMRNGDVSWGYGRTSRETLLKAQLTIADRSIDADDARDLLEMMDLLEIPDLDPEETVSEAVTRLPDVHHSDVYNRPQT